MVLKDYHLRQIADLREFVEEMIADFSGIKAEYEVTEETEEGCYIEVNLDFFGSKKTSMLFRTSKSELRLNIYEDIWSTVDATEFWRWIAFDFID